MTPGQRRKQAEEVKGTTPLAKKQKTTSFSAAASPGKHETASSSASASPGKQSATSPSAAASPGTSSSAAASPGKQKTTSPSASASPGKQNATSPSAAASPGKQKTTSPSAAASPGKQKATSSMTSIPGGGQATADFWGDEEHVLVDVPGKLELGSSQDAEWTSFSAEDSRFEIRVAVYPQATLYDGNTRSVGEYGLREYNKFSVHKGTVTIATIHDTNPNPNRKTPKTTKVFNAYFKGNNSGEDAADIEEMVRRQIGHLSNSGSENQNKRRKAKNEFRDRLVSTVLLAANNAHKHPVKSFPDGERQKYLWWARAMFYPVFDHDTLGNLSFTESATTKDKSPLEILQFGCMVEPLRVKSSDRGDFLSTNEIAENWMEIGKPTKSGGLTCSEDSMIDTLFFNRFPQKLLAHAPTYGLFFRMIRNLILEVATDRVAYEKEKEAEREAQGTLENGWTWTMHHQAVTSFKHMFAIAEQDEREKKTESRERRAFFKALRTAQQKK